MPTRPATHKPRSANTKKHQPQAINDNSWREGKTTAQRGYGGRWQRERKEFLKENPFCIDCLEKKGKHVIAKAVDHKKPHRGDQVLFWLRTNWQGLCTACHNAKTGRGY
jgi:5-methylcytosine-specific restriction protein A